MGAKSKWLAGDVPAARSILALAFQVGRGVGWAAGGVCTGTPASVPVEDRRLQGTCVLKPSPAH